MAKPVDAVSSMYQKKPGKKEIDHLRISKAENGGHIIEHQHTDYAHKPETHVFGDNQGEQMMMHIAQHMSVKPSEEASAEGAEPDSE